MMALLDRLHEDHENMSRLLEVLESQVELLRRIDPEVDHGLIRDIARYFTIFPDAVHHPLEEDLFALLRGKRPDLAGQLAALQREHIELAAIGREFHELMLTVCSGQPVRRDRVLAQAEQFLGRQRRHMHEEGHRVFRIAGEVLTEADFEALERRRGSGADPLFGEQLREDFVRLREAILAAGV